MSVQPLDLKKLKVFPLAERQSLTRADEVVIDPESAPKSCSAPNEAIIDECAEKIRAARARGATVMLIYGAH
ncbi:hypothetical protein ACYOEI_20720, partial [Singulisphaera rosea]